MRLDYRWTASARMTTQMSDNGDGSLSPVVWSCGKLLEGGPITRVYNHRPETLLQMEGQWIKQDDCRQVSYLAGNSFIATCQVTE